MNGVRSNSNKTMEYIPILLVIRNLVEAFQFIIRLTTHLIKPFSRPNLSFCFYRQLEPFYSLIVAYQHDQVEQIDARQKNTIFV
jgi:hypothetical protein